MHCRSCGKYNWILGWSLSSNKIFINLYSLDNCVYAFGAICVLQTKGTTGGKRRCSRKVLCARKWPLDTLACLHAVESKQVSDLETFRGIHKKSNIETQAIAMTGVPNISFIPKLCARHVKFGHSLSILWTQSICRLFRVDLIGMLSASVFALHTSTRPPDSRALVNTSTAEPAWSVTFILQVHCLELASHQIMLYTTNLCWLPRSTCSALLLSIHTGSPSWVPCFSLSENETGNKVVIPFLDISWHLYHIFL